MYYVHYKNNIHGPYTEDQVRAMYKKGEIQRLTQVYDQQYGQQWAPLEKFPALMRSPENKVFTTAPGSSVPIEAGYMERQLWEGRPTAWVNTWRYIKCLLFLLVLASACAGAYYYLWEKYELYVKYAVCAGLLMTVLTILKMFMLWIVQKARLWTLSTERLTAKEGLFSVNKDNIELYRIKDLGVKKPFFLRILGYGYVDLITSDKTSPTITIGPIKKPDDLKELIRKYAERERQRRGVREVDGLTS